MDTIDINVPMCMQDFIKIEHRGSYALMEEPKDIPIGAFIRLVCIDKVVDQGIVTSIDSPGNTTNKAMSPTFDSWWKINYEPTQTGNTEAQEGSGPIGNPVQEAASPEPQNS